MCDARPDCVSTLRTTAHFAAPRSTTPRIQSPERHGIRRLCAPNRHRPAACESGRGDDLPLAIARGLLAVDSRYGCVCICGFRTDHESTGVAWLDPRDRHRTARRAV